MIQFLKGQFTYTGCILQMQIANFGRSLIGVGRLEHARSQYKTLGFNGENIWAALARTAGRSCTPWKWALKN